MAVFMRGELCFEGAVLALREANHYDDSDFFASVWDGEKVTEVEYATTRAATYDNWAKVDATDEVLDKARAWFAERAGKAAVERDRAKAREPMVGRKVRVTKSRKGKYPVQAGAEGWVAAIVPGRAFRPVYSEWAKPENEAVVQVGDDLRYVKVSNLEVLDPEQYESDPEVLCSNARERAMGLEAGASEWWSGPWGWFLSGRWM